MTVESASATVQPKQEEEVFLEMIERAAVAVAMLLMPTVIQQGNARTGKRLPNVKISMHLHVVTF